MKIFYSFLIILALVITSCSSDVENQVILPVISETQINEITAETALLSWSASISDKSTLKFDIFLENKKIADNITSNSWIFNNLSESTSYSGKLLVTSNSGEIAEKEFYFITNRNPTPSDVNLLITDITTNKATLTWSASNIEDNSSILYDVYVNNELKHEDLDVLTVNLNNLNPSKYYKVKIIAKSNKNKISTVEKGFNALGVPPSRFPLVINNDDDDTDNLDPHWLMIQWTPPTVQDGFTYSYSIILDDKTIFHSLTDTASSWVFTTLNEGQTYTFKVIANSDNGASTEETITFTTIVHPNLSDFDIMVDSFTNTTANITWTPSTYPNHTSSINYDIYLNGKQQNPKLSAIYGTNYNFTDLTPNTEYIVKIIANKTVGHPVKTLSREIRFTTEKSYQTHPTLTVTEAVLYTPSSQYFSNQLKIKFSDSISAIDFDKVSIGGIIINNFMTYSTAIMSNTFSSENYNKILFNNTGYVLITENGITYKVKFDIVEKTN
ncbi:fibronectin type III domain-containing protein [Tenacibaculum piscium]|uniref:fibronectin type III domain-containing protein n=3 Tax=Tenacibaculum piscium TaxID=1458515 RepID=UPI001F2E8D6E|nr:fibronectin type III domain-containing protein [Tenacibaculum piscium]